MSQTQPTTVHRFIVAGTVEEAIYRLRERSSEEEEGAAGVGSPNKKAKRVEEAKTLTWEQLQYLFCKQGTANGAPDAVEMDAVEMDDEEGGEELVGHQSGRA